MEEKWSVDKLDGFNWMTWKFQMHHLLPAKGPWGFVDGSTVLAENPSAQVRAEFEQKSQRAFNYSTCCMHITTMSDYFS